MIDLMIGDVRNELRGLPEQSVHVCVSSPPYWSLRSYLPSDHPRKQFELGSEPTIEQFVENLCGVYDEVWRVLRDDGTCWVNLGDSYSGGGRGGNPEESAHQKQATNRGSVNGKIPDTGLAPGNCCMVPEQFALAMQKRGWVLRSKIIWAKAISVDAKMGSCMPESLNGTRWERCRVKVDGTGWKPEERPEAIFGDQNRTRSHAYGTHGGTVARPGAAEWIECPGCPKCESTGGYVLRRGSWRPTNAYEVIYMFSKGMGYYADIEAVKEAAKYGRCGWDGSAYGRNREADPEDSRENDRGSHNNGSDPEAGANIRSVWHIAEGYSIDDLFVQFLESLRPDNMVDVAHIKTQAFPGSHFATFPEAIPSLAIRVGTSEKGVCPSCKAPWARVVESTQLTRERPNDYTKRTGEDGTGNSCGNTVAGVESKTIGWRPTCDCVHYRLRHDVPEPILRELNQLGVFSGVRHEEEVQEMR